MLDSTKQNSEKARALRKLINKWRTSLETRSKAELLLDKNPGLKPPPGSPSKPPPGLLSKPPLGPPLKKS